MMSAHLRDRYNRSSEILDQLFLDISFKTCLTEFCNSNIFDIH